MPLCMLLWPNKTQVHEVPSRFKQVAPRQELPSMHGMMQHGVCMLVVPAVSLPALVAAVNCLPGHQTGVVLARQELSTVTAVIAAACIDTAQLAVATVHHQNWAGGRLGCKQQT